MWQDVVNIRGKLLRCERKRVTAFVSLRLEGYNLTLAWSALHLGLLLDRQTGWASAGDGEYIPVRASQPLCVGPLESHVLKRRKN